MSDGDLERWMLPLREGDLTALEHIYGDMRLAVYATALAVTANHAVAEDVTQEVFVRIFARARQYRPGTSPRAWIVAIARNLARAHVRTSKRESSAPDPDGIAAIAPESEATGQRMDLVNALLRLKPAEREIVALHDVAGFTHAEIATALRLPPGTVRWKYRVAIGRLRESLSVEIT